MSRELRDLETKGKGLLGRASGSLGRGSAQMALRINGALAGGSFGKRDRRGRSEQRLQGIYNHLLKKPGVRGALGAHFGVGASGIKPAGMPRGGHTAYGFGLPGRRV